MAIKTFTTGEVLTAADTNTYLANSGLVLVKQQTIGTGVSSITVTNAFSATYDNYRIVVSGGVFSSSVPVQFKVGPSSPATGYYAMLIYSSYGGAISNAAVTNGSYWNWMGFGSSGGIGATVDILTPFASKNTFCIAGTYNHVGGGGTCQGILGDTNSYTDLIVQPEAGTATGGTITVYGYRKA